MNDKQDRPYACEAPGCSQRFQLEEHLIIHRHKHEMTLRFPSIKTDTAFTDQTPTPTRFLQNCEEVGLFKEIEEEFLQAQEEEKSKQTLSHNGPPCINQHQLKPQLHLQHPHPQPPLHHPQTHPLQHPQPHGPMMGLSCSLAAQQTLSSSSQSGSVITQAPSTLSHSGPVPGPLSSLLHMRNRHRQPLPASLPGTLPDPAMQGASAQHMPMEKQMSCIMGIPGPVHNPSCSSPQRSKQTLGHHYQHHHPGMVSVSNPVTSMGHMMEMMSHRQQAPPIQHHQHPHHHHHHHHHHHPQLPTPPLTYPQRCHAPPPQHLASSHSHQLQQSRNVSHAQVHQSPPPHLHQGSPPAPPLSVPAQVSPVAQQMQPSQPLHSQHAVQAGGSCSSGGGGGGGGGGGSRRRRTAEQDPDERRQKFLERNRAAATRCRQKRKLWVSSLEKKAEELTHTNLQLQNEVTSLRSEVGQLKQILLTHKDCPVTARQREAQGYPTAGVSPGGSPTPLDSGSHLQAIQHNSISTSSTAGGDSQHDPQPGH
ncbi:cyclic AMP-responsive element-binding protein 5-like [Aulostomus maculatus]